MVPCCTKLLLHLNFPFFPSTASLKTLAVIFSALNLIPEAVNLEATKDLALSIRALFIAAKVLNNKLVCTKQLSLLTWHGF